MTQKIRGRHRRQGQRAAVMGALPIAIAISYSSVAVAAPQPGTTDEVQPEDAPSPTTAQPGTTTDSDSESDADSDKAAPTTERAKDLEPKSYWVAPPPEYTNVPTRELPTYYEYDEQEEEYVAPEPVQVQELHLPEPVAPVAPIEAPEDKLRIGDFITEKPVWMSEQDMEKTNNSAAVAEAQVATFWNSIGVETSRSDRIAAATTAGVLGGGAIGALGCGVPAAVAGGVVGGIIGGAVSGAPGAVTVLSTFGLTAPVVVPSVILSTAGGVAIGAAAAGIPAAAVCGTAGAVIGGVGGATFGAGDESIAPTVEHDQGVAPILPEQAAPGDEEAAPAPAAPSVEAAPPAPSAEVAPPVEAAPPAPAIDSQSLGDRAEQLISQVETLPGGAVLADNLNSFVDAVPQLVDNTNDYAAEQGEALSEAGVEVPTLV